MIMIQDTKLNFVYMGLFESRDEWIHPTVTVDTYEIIFVTAGCVHIRERDKVYHVKKGEMLLLDAGVEHGGVEISYDKVSFYWLHFETDKICFFNIPKTSIPNSIRPERVFREIMQYNQRGETVLAELTLGRFLLECGASVERHNKIAYEISEYIRISSDKKITVEDISARFGYAPDHISRLLKTEFGVGAKTLIIEKRLAYIESVLINTNGPIGVIAEKCGFDDENAFLKFFKYHEKITPTQFRNEFYRVHMNSK